MVIFQPQGMMSARVSARDRGRGKGVGPKRSVGIDGIDRFGSGFVDLGTLRRTGDEERRLIQGGILFLHR